ncbi:hypothetical protein MKX07_000715 [Trichoderma sp. CBMAI-0711]|nr:hypothetical protein MKX07_000715 [Trichoderma sp. CBMAI-0711]
MCGQVVAQGSWWEEEEESNLFESVGVKENPSKLNDLGRVLGNVHTVLIAGGRNMDDDVAVDVELGHLLRRHDGGGFAGSGQYLRDAGKGVEAATMAGSLATGR